MTIGSMPCGATSGIVSTSGPSADEDGRSRRLLVADVDDRQSAPRAQPPRRAGAGCAEHERAVRDAQRARSRRSTRAARRSGPARRARGSARSCERTPHLADADHGGRGVAPRRRRAGSRPAARRGPPPRRARPGSARSPPRPAPPRAGHEHLLGELAARRVQLVGDRGERPALPARLGGDARRAWSSSQSRCSRSPSSEERVRRLGQRAARSRARPRSRRARRSSSGCQAAASASGERDAARGQRLAAQRVLGAPRRRCRRRAASARAR